MIARWRLRTFSSRPASAICFLIFCTPGSMPMQALHAAHALHLRQLLGRSSRSNWPLGSFLAMRSALATSRFGGGLLDQRDHVALAEDAAGDAAGVEHVQRLDPLAGAEELDRQAGDRAHGERRAAAGVAVGAGEHQAGERHALVERRGGAHRVLAGQAVGHQQGLGGLAMRAISAASLIIASSSVVRPAVSRISTS